MSEQDLSFTTSPEEEEVLEEFLFQFLGDKEDEDKDAEATADISDKEEEISATGREGRSASVWANSFTFNPTVFEGFIVKVKVDA